jgi:hypothetical protein
MKPPYIEDLLYTIFGIIARKRWETIATKAQRKNIFFYSKNLRVFVAISKSDNETTWSRPVRGRCSPVGKLLR